MKIQIVEKKYPKGNVALKDIDLEFYRGKSTLIIGTSGAGKSTLIKCIIGTTSFNGKTSGYSREQIAYIPQHPALNRQETAYEAIYWSALFSRKYRKKEEREAAINKQIHDLGLDKVKDQKIKDLSGGQAQRVSIAKELIRKKSIIIADEIDTGLDCGVSKYLVSRLCEIGRKEQLTTIVISHNIVNLELYDNVIVLVKSSENIGRIAYYGPKEGIGEFFDIREGRKNDREIGNDYVNILLKLNAEDEGGGGQADYYIKKYSQKPVRF